MVHKLRREDSMKQMETEPERLEASGTPLVELLGKFVATHALLGPGPQVRGMLCPGPSCPDAPKQPDYSDYLDFSV